MKVILLKDVAKMGRKNSVVDVPDGYALNQLIPKKLAEAATPVNLKKLANIQVTSKVTTSNQQKRFEESVALLLASPLVITTAQVNDQGHLFMAIHVNDVIAAAAQRGAILEPKEVVIEQTIKSLGVHSVTLKQGGTTTVCAVEIIKKA
jgi:large subunit ribosomal protein L9